ncbi:MAG TPA: choice-of-anchor Q domain-containing protein [Pyrinomonadaceae bacterium]
MRYARVFLSFCFVLCLSAAISAATYTVTKIADTNDGACDAADCSLREAIAAANATADNDTILFGSLFSFAPKTITLSGTEIVIAANGSLTINGTGANRLTVSGNGASRIFTGSANSVVNINNLRLTGGNGAGATNTGRGGAVYNVGGTMVITNSVLTGNSAANGGAINNAAATGGIDAHLTIINCVLSNNSSTSSGAALQNFSTSTLHMRNTTVNNNTSSGTGIAGAFQANGTVTITNSTFSGNSAPAGTGGGVYFNGSSMIMTNTTIANNSCQTGGGGLHRTGTAATANVRNTIIANNNGAAATPDVSGAITSQGNNIIRMVGTSTGWVASDLQNTDPLLAPLGYYGSEEKILYTHALLNNSPAINAGNNCVTDLTCGAANPPVALTTDERGAARAGNVDIGAFEVNSAYVAVLPDAVSNQAYNFTLAINTGGFIYMYLSGSPPQGLGLNSSATTAFFGGSPVTLGTFDFGIGGNNLAPINYRISVVRDLNVASIGGIVTTSTGAAVPNAVVRITDSMNNTRFARTNGFGYFRFDDVPRDQTYTVSVVSKQYQFQPQTITVTDNVTNLNFTAQP